MRLYKREDTGKWCFDLHIDGKRIRRTTYNTKAEARKAAQEIIQNGDSSNITFKDYFENWVNVHKKNFVTKKTYQRYMNSMNKFVEYFGENKKLDAVKRTEYQAFINDYASTHYRQSVRKLHNCLSAAFNEAEYEKLIVTNPTYKIQISGIDDNTEKIKFINDRDYLNMIDYVRENLTKSNLIIFILSITGGRFSEVNRLTQDDLIDEHTVHLRGTKTKTSDRYVKISAEDMMFIKESLNKLNVEGDELFGLSNNGVNKAFRLLQKRLDFEDNVTLHAIRHTHVSYLFSRGVDIRYISQRLGHANVGVTLSIYTHLVKEDKLKEESKTVDVLARKWHDELKETGVTYDT